MFQRLRTIHYNCHRPKKGCAKLNETSQRHVLRKLFSISAIYISFSFLSFPLYETFKLRLKKKCRLNQILSCSCACTMLLNGVPVIGLKTCLTCLSHIFFSFGYLENTRRHLHKEIDLSITRTWFITTHFRLSMPYICVSIP